MTSYIRVFTNGIGDLTGYRLNFSSVSKVPLSLGVDYFDISLPQSINTGRLLVAGSGVKEDMNLGVDLIDSGDNKCFQYDNLGNITALNKSTTKDQVNFIRNSIISQNITAIYQVYLDWLDASFFGVCSININATDEEYFSTVPIDVIFKSGSNVFGL